MDDNIEINITGRLTPCLQKKIGGSFFHRLKESTKGSLLLRQIPEIQAKKN